MALLRGRPVYRMSADESALAPRLVQALAAATGLALRSGRVAIALMGGLWVGGTISASGWTMARVRLCTSQMSVCFDRPQREATIATSWLMVLAAVALVVFLLALLALFGRSGNLGWTGIAGLVCCGLGLGGLALATLPHVRDQLRPLPMMAAIAVGLALLGWTVLRSGLIPTWAAIALLIGFLPLGGVSEQTSRVLLALPFGLAWVVVGIALIQRRRIVLRAEADRVDKTSDGSGGISSA